MTRHRFLRGGLLVVALLASGLPALADTVVKSGAFAGENGHETSGSVQIVEASGAYLIRLGADFFHDGTAPDITVGYGGKGYDPASNLGRLAANKGAQDYPLPKGFDPAAVRRVYIWCREFSVSLGVASLR